jgi:hypothetical protein
MVENIMIYASKVTSLQEDHAEANVRNLLRVAHMWCLFVVFCIH